MKEAHKKWFILGCLGLVLSLSLSHLAERFLHDLNMKGGKGYTDRPRTDERPALVPFTRDSPRFAKELTFAPLIDCPTPGALSPPDFFATKGYDSYGNPVFAFLRSHTGGRRKWRQPEQGLKFKSKWPSQVLAEELSNHLQRHGFALKRADEGPLRYAGVDPREANRDGQPRQSPTKTITHLSFTDPKWQHLPLSERSVKFQPEGIYIELAEEGKDDGGFGQPGTFSSTLVWIHCVDYRFREPM